MQAKCKKCGAVWANIDEIEMLTMLEHRKATGHMPEVDMK